MFKIELHEILQLGKFITFINTEERAFLTMVMGELDAGLDLLKWGMI